MRSLLSLRLSSGVLWLILFLSIGILLIFNPALHQPQSYAIALGGGLLFLALRPLEDEALARMGRAWWLSLLFALASVGWSLSPGNTLRSVGFLGLGTLLYLMARTLDIPQRSKLASLGFFLATVVAVLALHQWLFKFRELQATLPQVPTEDLGIATAYIFNKRATGPLLTPGSLAALMIFFLPFGAIQAFLQKGGKRIFYSVTTWVLVAALLVSQSVGALICLTLAVLAVLGYRRLGWWTLVVLGMGGLAFFGVLSWRTDDWWRSAFSGRIELWKTAWSLFLSHPFLGTGLGSFEEAYRGSGVQLSGGSIYSHNLLLQLLVETGLVGMALFTAAFIGWARRFKVPSRWEGWGVMTGTLALFLFCFLDIPLQMPELLWLFAGVTGLLELTPEKPLRLPKVPQPVIETLLLGVFLVAGFWPPYRPWNFAFLASALWCAMAFSGRKVGSLPFWVFAGASFIFTRAFTSPSALGTVRFLETAGLVLCSILFVGGLSSKSEFLKKFLWLGAVWGAWAWFLSFTGRPFEAWTTFPNPKHLAVFLVPLALLYIPSKGKGWKGTLVFGAVLATLARLRATGALLGVLVGGLFHPGITRGKKILLLAVLCAGAWWVHSHQPSSTQWDRLLIWKAATKVWMQHPLEGSGPGAFDGEFHRVKEPRQAEVGRYLMDAKFVHNEFLEFLVSFGLAGMIFLGVLVWKAVRKSKEERPALIGLTVSSLLDFCLHTPLNLLQAAGFLSDKGQGSREGSWTGVVLAGFLALGLFGSACFAPALVKEAGQAKADRKYRETLRMLEKAEQLNPWDVRYASAKADFLEELYLSTADPIWRRKSDQAIDRVLSLEKKDGEGAYQKVRKATRRLPLSSKPEDLQAVEDDWEEAGKALPFNAYVLYERGSFHRSMSQRKGGDGFPALEKARMDLEKAVELEPSFSMAWAWLGRCRKDLSMAGPARSDFQKALEIHERWKDAPGLGPVEKGLVDLTPEMEAFLKRETAR